MKRLIDYFSGVSRNFALRPNEYDLKEIKLLEIVSSHVDNNMLPIGKQRDLNIMIKEINLRDNLEYAKSLIGRVVAVNYYSSDIIKKILSASDYINLNDEICNAPVEYLGYM